MKKDFVVEKRKEIRSLIKQALHATDKVIKNHLVSAAHSVSVWSSGIAKWRRDAKRGRL